MKKKKDPEAVEESKVLSSQNQLKSFLKRTEGDHYNNEVGIEYKVSGGSLNLDYHTGGGLGPGLHRFLGLSEGGKTSCALQYMFNFLSEPQNTEEPRARKGVYIKAEGRLGKEMMKRSGIKFVFNFEEWVDGTCFVFECNLHETVFSLMRELIGKNDEKTLYFFLLDSVDGLIRKGDLAKTFEETAKVAGGAVLAADLMKRVSIAMQKRGHIAIFISQVRANIQLDDYSKEPVRQTTATGGNALLHFADWILEFQPRFKGDLILKDENADYHDQKNPYIGHFAKVVVKKSPNEKTNTRIRFPIKYGRSDGKSNWIEKEIIDFLLGWGLVERKGAWVYLSDELIEKINGLGIEGFNNPVHGLPKFEAFINDNANLSEFLIQYIKEHILAECNS